MLAACCTLPRHHSHFSPQSPFDVAAAASTSTSTSDLGSDIKPTEAISASADAAAAAAELLTPAEEPRLNSAIETAAEEIEMSELRAGGETAMGRGKSESLVWYLERSDNTTNLSRVCKNNTPCGRHSVVQ